MSTSIPYLKLQLLYGDYTNSLSKEFKSTPLDLFLSISAFQDDLTLAQN